MRKTLPTWAGRSKFSYEGSAKEGTVIRYGSKGWRATVRAEQYDCLLKHFRGREVDIGTSRDKRPACSVGAWLRKHVTKTAIASYVGPILLAEGYAERVAYDTSKIRIK